MKTLYKLSVTYAMIGIIGGVFFREFTKFQSFEGTTTLGFVHTHAFMLGMFFFLIVIILEKLFKLSFNKQFGKFLMYYNSGLILTIIMLVVRGIPQVLQSALSTGLNAGISGMAGVGHILITVGLVYFFMALKKSITKE